MSDDFDKDDLSWLRGPEDDDQPGEEDSPDWQRDSGEQARGEEGLGFTGELPWMQGEGSAPGVPGSASSGLTGELPWMQGQQQTDPAQDDDLAWLSDSEDDLSAPEDEPADDDAALDWMTEPEAFDELDEFEAAVPAEEDDIAWLSASQPETPAPELPDWLKATDVSKFTAQEPVTDEGAAGDDLPAWLPPADVVDLDADETSPAAEPEPETPEWLTQATAQEPALDAMDVPDWLMGIEDEIVGAGAGEPTLGDKPSDEWLAQGELLPETPSIEMTFDQWMTRQAEAEQPPDLDKEVPLSFGVDDEETAEPLVTGTGDLPSWFLGMEELDQTGAPDWFAAEEAAPTPQAAEEDALPDWLLDEEPAAQPAAAIDEDLFAELTFDELPGDEFIPAQPQAAADQPEPAEMSVDDYLASLGSQQVEASQDDWLAAFEEPAAPTAASGWLEELGDIQDLPAAEAIPADLSFMDEPEFDLETLPPQPAAARQDIDSILAALDAGDAQLPMTGDLLSGEVDFDSLLADPAFSEIEREAPRVGDDVIQGDSLDFLTELGAAVSATSAAAIVRQRQDRPLDELPDRLQKLRARSDEAMVPPPKGNTAPLSELLPGVSGTLVPAPVEIDSPGIAAAITISPEQQRRVDLLKSLAITEQATAGAATPSAIDLTYDTPALADDEALPDFGLEEGATPAAPVVAAAPRIRARRKFDRVIFALLLAAAVIAPFFLPQLRIGSLPPAEFAADSRQRSMFDAIARLQPGDYVLVAVEYGPTAAGELDGTLNVLLQHILAQRARPVLLGGSPLGLLRASAMLTDLGRVDSPLLARTGRSTPFRANEDYFVVRYLSGGMVGLRALGEDPAPLLANDYQGQATNLTLQSIDDFALVLVVAERAEDVRLWAEQVGTLTNAPLLAAVGYAAEPMSEPYLGSGIDGLLVGYGDAFTYSRMFSGGSVPIQQTTETPPTSAPVEVTEEATVEALVDETATLAPPTQTPETAASATAAPPTATQESTNTPVPPTATVAASASPIQPSATLQPSETTAPTAGPTNTAQPSSTPRPTNTATASPTTLATIITARVIASDRVNVRSEPSRESQPLSSLAPGETVPVIGRNGDGSWIQVRLPDGREGWVSAPLLEITAQTADQSTPTATQASALIVVMADTDLSLFRRPVISQVETTPEAEGETTAEPTPASVSGAAEATETSSGEASAPMIAENRLETAPYAEERWYSMTFGLAATILIITLGALANIVRGILRRGRR